MMKSQHYDVRSVATQLLVVLNWARRNLKALVTDDDGSGCFIRGTGTEIAGFGAGMDDLDDAIKLAADLSQQIAQQESTMIDDPRTVQLKKLAAEIRAASHITLMHPYGATVSRWADRLLAALGDPTGGQKEAHVTVFEKAMADVEARRGSEGLRQWLATLGGDVPPGGPSPQQAALRLLLPSVPQGNDWHANRYDTDDSMVLKLWRTTGEEPRMVEYDCPKQPLPAGDPHGPDEKDQKVSRMASPHDAENARTAPTALPSADAQASLLNPVSQVYFRAGLLACREYMAQFVSAESPSIAMSIRANWWPELGHDYGVPRKLAFAEVTCGEHGTPAFRVKTREEVSPTLEALPIALAFLSRDSPAGDAVGKRNESEGGDTK